MAEDIATEKSVALKGHKYVIDTGCVAKSHMWASTTIDTGGISESHKLVNDNTA